MWKVDEDLLNTTTTQGASRLSQGSSIMANPHGGSQHESSAGNTRNNSPDIGTTQKDYTNRLHWNLEIVELFFPDQTKVVAMGAITVSQVIGGVDDEALGETHVGVTIMKVYSPDYFPNFKRGCLPW